MSTPSSPDVDRLKRREAWFRLKTVQDFIVLDGQLREQGRRIDAINDELGARNTYIHELHRRQEASALREQGAAADLETFVWRLQKAEDEAARLRDELRDIRSSWSWRLFASLQRFQRRWGRPAGPGPAGALAGGASSGLATDPGAAPGGVFIYHLRTSPFRWYRGKPSTLRGWAWPANGRSVLAVRVRIDGALFPGLYGLEEEEVIARHGVQASNPKPGFEIEFHVPPGRHRFGLEAEVDGQGWQSILTAPVWADASSADSPPARSPS